MKNNDNLGKIDKLEKEIDGLIKAGEYQKGVGLVETFGEKNNYFDTQIELSKEITKYYLIYTKILNKQQKFYKVIELLETLIEKIRKEGKISNLIYVDLNLQLGYAYYRVGNLDDAIRLCEELLTVLEGISTVETEVLNRRYQIERLFASVSFLDSNFQASEEHFLKSLEAAIKISNPNGQISAYVGLGNLNWAKGELNQALDNYYKSLSFEEHLTKESKATIYRNIAAVFQQQGRLDLAQESLKTSIGIYKQFNLPEIAIGYDIMGLLYYKQGNIDEAIKYMEKAHQITQKTEIKRAFVENAFRLAIILIENNRLNDPKTGYYLSYLRDLAVNHPEFHLAVLANKLIEAILLKQSKQIEDLATARKILKELITDKRLRFSFGVYAYFNLLEILLLELKISKNDELFDEIKTIILELIEKAERNNYYPLLIKSKLLMSQLQLVTFDYNKSRKTLSQAQKIAEEKGLINLAIRVSAMHDILLHQFETMEKLVREKLTLTERLSYSYFDNLLMELTKPKMMIKPSTLTSESPKLFVILNRNSNYPIYTYSFLDDFKETNSYLKKIHSVVKLLGDNKFEVERVKVGDSNVLIKTDKELLLLFCYIFSGDSYTAKLKCEIVIETLKGFANVWTEIRDNPNELTDFQESLIT